MIVYDIEIKKPPVDTGKQGYEYAKGWEDYIGMGISVVVLYDYETDQYMTFDDSKHELEKLGYHMAVADTIVGFNIQKFDNPLLKAHGVEVNPNKCYDILRHLWSAHGLDPNMFDPKTHGGFSLDKVLKCNFDDQVQKSMSGADAPYMWQDGLHQEVVDYCINDVRIERAVMDRIFHTGGLISPIYKKFVRLPLP